MEYSKGTMYQAEKIKEIIDAVLTCKEVQIFKDGSWTNVGDDPDLMLVLSYPCRVNTEPKYVPFTFEDAKDLIGKTVKRNNFNSFYVIISSSQKGVMLINEIVSYKILLENYTFIDGTQCGKIENQ